MKARAGLVVALSVLGLGIVAPVSAPPSATAAADAAGVSPTLVAALQTAWNNGYRDAWGQDGGVRATTWNDPNNPADPTLTHRESTLTLDVHKHRWMRVQRSSSSPWQDKAVYVGRTRLDQTIAPVRHALRIHRAPHPAWTSARMSARNAKLAYDRAAGRITDRSDAVSVSDLDWQTLTATTDDRGRTTYTGSYRVVTLRSTPAGSAVTPTGPLTYTPTVTVQVDQLNRPVSWDESGLYDGTSASGQDAFASSRTTWAWNAGHVAKPVAHNAARPATQGELRAWGNASHMAYAANHRNHANGPQPATVAYLHRRFSTWHHQATSIKNGIRLREHAAGHTFTWKVVIRAGRAVAIPVHN